MQVRSASKSSNADAACRRIAGPESGVESLLADDAALIEARGGWQLYAFAAPETNTSAKSFRPATRLEPAHALTNVIDVYINLLRRKLEGPGRRPLICDGQLIAWFQWSKLATRVLPLTCWTLPHGL